MMTEPVDHPFFGTESSPGADPAPLETAAPVPAETADPQEVAEEAAAAEPQTPQPPAPDWLQEVRNNAGGIVGRAIEELYKLVTGG